VVVSAPAPEFPRVAFSGNGAQAMRVKMACLDTRSASDLWFMIPPDDHWSGCQVARLASKIELAAPCDGTVRRSVRSRTTPIEI
jgi:hypothetical protein